MDFLFVMQLVARFGVQAYRNILCSTTAGAVVHSFLAMDGFVRGTGADVSPPFQ